MNSCHGYRHQIVAHGWHGVLHPITAPTSVARQWSDDRLTSSDSKDPVQTGGAGRGREEYPSTHRICRSFMGLNWERNKILNIIDYVRSFYSRMP